MLNTEMTSSPKGGRQAMVTARESAKASTPADNSPREAIGETRESAKACTPARASLYALAGAALRIADNDIEAARARVEQSLSDPLVRAGVVEDALVLAVNASLAAIKSNRRTMIERSAIAGPDVLARARAVGMAFLNWPMRSGGILANATREQVIADADAYEQTARTEARRAAFLRSVAAAMGDAASVADALSEDAARSLWEAVNV